MARNGFTGATLVPVHCGKDDEGQVTSRVKFGVRIHQSGYSYEALRQVWTQADRLGYYSATLYDLLNVPTLECWTALSALAAQTRQITSKNRFTVMLRRNIAPLAFKSKAVQRIAFRRLSGADTPRPQWL